MIKTNEKIIKHICNLNNNVSVHKELNIIEWNKCSYLDIRKWSKEGLGKGISLTLPEAEQLEKNLHYAIESLRNITQNTGNNTDLTNLPEITDKDVD